MLGPNLRQSQPLLAAFRPALKSPTGAAFSDPETGGQKWASETVDSRFHRSEGAGFGRASINEATAEGLQHHPKRFGVAPLKPRRTSKSVCMARIEMHAAHLFSSVGYIRGTVASWRPRNAIGTFEFPMPAVVSGQLPLQALEIGHHVQHKDFVRRGVSCYLLPAQR
jgi:hypothetical protein